MLGHKVKAADSGRPTVPVLRRGTLRVKMGSMTQVPTPQTRMTLLKHKRELIKRARKIAAKGGFRSFDEVRAQFDDRDAETLKLWATARDRAEVDRICADTQLRRH